MRKIRQRLSILLVVLMIISQTTILSANTNQDYLNSWASKTIVGAINKGWISLYADQSFKPNQSITRLEFVEIINKAFQVEETTSEIQFIDVTKGDACYNEVAKAVAAGYINGYPDHSFKPHHSITRQEIAKILAKFLNLNYYVEDLASNFKDSNIKDAWAQENVNGLVGYGLIKGYPDGTFGYNKNMTRAEAVVLVTRAHELVAGETGIQALVSEENTILADVPVSLYNQAGKLVNTSHTDLLGNVVFKNITPGKYYLEVNHEDYHTISHMLNVRQGFMTLEQIYKKVKVPINGKIIDSSHTVLTKGTPVIFRGGNITTTVNKDGEFNQELFANTLYEVYVKINNQEYFIGEFMSKSTETNVGVLKANFRFNNNSSSGGGDNISDNESILPSINVDTTDFAYDIEKDMYYLYEHIETLNGTLVKSEQIAELLYEILDINGEVLQSEKMDVRQDWSIKSIGFVIGENTLRIKGITKNNKTVHTELKIFNFNEKNTSNLELDMNDDDNDGVVNYIEQVYGTNKDLVDTDEDGISDYIEIAILGTDPLNKDTNNDGILDGDEDHDNDGLTNIEEVLLGTNLIIKDTDHDNLNDGEENKYGTNPLVADTDEDGLDDGDEIALGFNPLTPNASFDTYKEGSGIYSGEEVKASVDIKGLSAAQIQTLEVKPVKHHPFLTPAIPGYMGSAYDFSVEGSFDEAILSFEFDSALIKSSDFEPRIYYYNEKEQLLEELPNQRVEGNKVIATTDHFSIYILLNKVAFEDIWNGEIKPPVSEDERQDLDVVFVIDRSKSMMDNDPQGLRKETAKEFVKKLSENDRAAVVTYTRIAQSECELTTSSALVVDCINNIIDDSGKDFYSGTATHRGIAEGIRLFEESNRNTLKYMIVLTDGEDTVSGNYDALISRANDIGIKIFTVGLGTSIDTDLLEHVATSTGGKYYYASEAEDLLDQFDSITEETMEYLDSNSDGISDYHTRLLCEGKLNANFHTNPFRGIAFEDIQTNDDYDGDGVKNGEELKVTVYDSGEVFAYLKSDPTKKDTDGDLYDDYEEHYVYKTDPRVSNILIDKADIDFVTKNGRFVASDYKASYDNEYTGWMHHTGEWIGNNFFGSNYDKVALYKKSLVEYFESISSNMEKSLEIINYIEEVNNLCKYVQEILDAGKTMIEIEDTNALRTLNSAQKDLELANNKLSEIISSSGGLKEGTEEVIDDIIAAYDKAKVVIPDLEEKHKVQVTLLEKLEGLGKSEKIEKISGFMNAYEYISIALDAKSNYCNLKNQVELMEEQYYILEVIYNNSTNEHLAEAAKELMDIILEDRSIVWDSLEQMMINIGSNLLSDAAHNFIGRIPVAGQYIEMVRIVGNLVFNISEVAENCTLTYGVTTTAELLNEDFKVGLEYPISYSAGTKRAFFGSNKVYGNKYINLIAARCQGEDAIIEAVEARSWLTEWYVKEYLYNVVNAEENIEKLQTLFNKYYYMRSA